MLLGGRHGSLWMRVYEVTKSLVYVGGCELRVAGYINLRSHVFLPPIVSEVREAQPSRNMRKCCTIIHVTITKQFSEKWDISLMSWTALDLDFNDGFSTEAQCAIFKLVAFQTPWGWHPIFLEKAIVQLSSPSPINV